MKSALYLSLLMLSGESPVLQESSNDVLPESETQVMSGPLQSNGNIEFWALESTGGGEPWSRHRKLPGWSCVGLEAPEDTVYGSEGSTTSTVPVALVGCPLPRTGSLHRVWVHVDDRSNTRSVICSVVEASPWNTATDYEEVTRSSGDEFSGIGVLNFMPMSLADEPGLSMTTLVCELPEDSSILGIRWVEQS